TKPGQSQSGRRSSAAARRSRRVTSPATKVRTLSYSSTRRPADVTRLTALMREHRLAEARECARELLQGNPNIPDLANLVDVLDLMPESGDLIPFRDDSTRDVQILARPGAATIVFLFCGAQHALGLPLAVAHEWFGRMPASLVYLRDFNGMMHYFGGIRSIGDRLTTLDALRSIVSQTDATRIVCIGLSSGTAGALRYGLDLLADVVVGFAGWIDFSQEFNRYLRSAATAEELRRLYPSEGVDLPSAYRDASRRPRALIVYGDNSWEDRLHAERMRSCPGVTLLPLDSWPQHNVIPELIGRHWLSRLLDWSITPDCLGLPQSIPAGFHKPSIVPKTGAL